MRGKLVNLMNSYKIVSNSGSYWDLLWLREMWLDIITEWDDYDYILFSLSNVNFHWGVLPERTIKVLKELKETTKPVLWLFLDFKTYTNKLKNRKNYPNLEDYQFEDYKDNRYLLTWTRDVDKCKERINNQKNWIKFKEENIIYFNNMTFWYYWMLPILEKSNWKICYVWNWRWWDRNEFLSRFNWFDVFGNWKDKQKEELNHNFMWVAKQTQVKNIINKYYWQIVTYDKIGIDYKVDVTRLVYTIAAWTLPLIDKRLKYLWLPDRFWELYIENQDDVNRITWFEQTKRNWYIKELREYFDKELDKQKEMNKIYNIIKKYNENK